MSPPGETTCLLEKADVHQRWFMKSQSHMWFSIIAMSIAISLASGPIYGWETLEPIMISEGCTYSLEQLDAFDSVARGLSIASVFPAGLVFDIVGPRALCVSGTIITAFSLVIMSLSLMFPGYLNGLLGPSYVAASTFSVMLRRGPYIYLWVLGDHPSTVNALIAASYPLTDTIALISVALYSCCGVYPGPFYLCIAVLCFGVAGLCYVLLPSHEEALHLKKRLFEAQRLTLSAASETDNEKEEEDIMVEELGNILCFGRSVEFFKRERTLMYDLAIFLVHIYPVMTAVMMAHVTSMYMVLLTLIVNQYEFYLSMFSETFATDLNDDFLYIYAVGGASGVIIIGYFLNKIGLELVLVLLNIMSLSFIVSVLIPYAAAQIVAMVLATFILPLFQVLLIRFARTCCPPEIFGSYAGMLYLLLGLGMVILSAIATSVSACLFSVDNVWNYNIQFIFWGAMMLLTGVLFFWWVTFKQPIPKPGQMSMKDIHRLRS